MNNPFQSHHTSRVPHKLWRFGDVYFPTAPNIYSGGRGNQTTTFGRNGISSAIEPTHTGLDPRPRFTPETRIAGIQVDG
jgi:hypothetical protein